MWLDLIVRSRGDAVSFKGGPSNRRHRWPLGTGHWAAESKRHSGSLPAKGEMVGHMRLGNCGWDGPSRCPGVPAAELHVLLNEASFRAVVQSNLTSQLLRRRR